MPENILVVEYEPRYTDRVRQALAGQPFVPSFAKDGEEALRALAGSSPLLIVLSSVVPKVSTAELIRAIRGRDALQQTPILLTVSGYNGKSPKQDAVRLGASDILPKPYSETEFLGKVQQMLGLRPSRVQEAERQLTSNEIFGDLLDDRSPLASATRRPMKPTDDVDKLLADTLGGVMPQKKKEPTSAGTAPVPPAPAAKSKSDYDKALQDTLSGLEKNARRTSGGTVPLPSSAAAKPAPAGTPPQTAAASSFQTEKVPAFTEKMPLSSPLLTPPLAAPFEEDEPADGIRFGQYVLLEKIATGGMAEVWKARMRGVEGFQKIVAIKKILPHLSDNQDFVEMFIDEAKLAAQLNHNNIIHIYDLGKIQSSYYIAMEYIDGSDLKAILKKAQDRDHPMSVELALFITSKVAAALDYAHRKHDFEGKEMGLVHRDVSPQNVLISEEGDIKLCDFGIAKAASKASHTQAGALKGKLQYMSPEQAWGRQIDRRSDVFALATVLYEMLTARKLFGGDNELSILEQVREARVIAPSQANDEVTPPIDAIVLKALQKEPSSRYQSAGEMQRDIDAVLYTFKPTPTSADLAIYMHRLGSPEPLPVRVEAPLVHEAEPEPAAANELRPIAVTPPPRTPAPVAPVSAAVVPMPAWEAHAAASVPHAPAAEKKSPVMAIVIGLVVVVAAAGGYFAFRDKFTSKPAAAAAPVNRTASAAPGTVSGGTIVPTGTVAPAPGTVAPTSTAPAIDAGRVDEEVRKRLAAERARLDQLARQQQAAAQTPVVNRPPQPQPQLTQTVAPPPAPAPVVPEPQPVVPAPQPVVPAPAPAPQPAEPQAARAQTGDLVDPGTPGLTPPRMTRQALASYPAIAKMQRIQGSVTVNALISETGQVVDTRIISTANPILNDAAVQSVRRSTFAPGSKDGARVRSWTAVRVEFKL
ncbi:MAG: TonB family protein [Acidobacteriota bacterium]